MHEIIAQLEPAPRSVVQFGHRYDSGAVYTFCAVRTDSLNTHRWFLSGGSAALRGSAPNSPCTWPELFQFADTPIQVATAWEQIRLAATEPTP